MGVRDGTNPKVPRKVASCCSCLGWGLTYCQDLCKACYDFASRYKVAGDCGACGRDQPLKRGYCRLCWCQAYLERTTGPGYPLAPWVKKVRHHQLFFAGMHAGLKRHHAPPRALPRRYGEKGRPRKPPPPVVTRPSPPSVQLSLVEDAGSRRYRWGRVDLRSGPPPANRWLALGLHLAHTMAESRGMGPGAHRALNRVLVMVLADYAGGDAIRVSDFFELVRTHGDSVTRTVEILGQMGVLDDDRPPVFETWLAGKVEGLAPGIASEAERWVLAQRYGTPRRRPRPGAATSYLYGALPALAEWSRRHDHLREVTRGEVVAHADALFGRQRQVVVVALRSLFAWAKRECVVFANPATRIPLGAVARPVWQPLAAGDLARTLEVATTPRDRLVIALAAVHAARNAGIRSMTIDDVDLANRRLTIAGHTRPLDELTRKLLVEWLGYRQRRWPNTANPHLVISRSSAVGLEPISRPSIGLIVRGLPGTLERLRIDRQLEEALTHGADPLHLAAVFGVHENTAIRYADSARQLLERPHESPPVDSGRTQASDAHGEPDEHWGSP